MHDTTTHNTHPLHTLTQRRSEPPSMLQPVLEHSLEGMTSPSPSPARPTHMPMRPHAPLPSSGEGFSGVGNERGAPRPQQGGRFWSSSGGSDESSQSQSSSGDVALQRHTGAPLQSANTTSGSGGGDTSNSGGDTSAAGGLLHQSPMQRIDDRNIQSNNRSSFSAHDLFGPAEWEMSGLSAADSVPSGGGGGRRGRSETSGSGDTGDTTGQRTGQRVPAAGGREGTNTEEEGTNSEEGTNTTGITTTSGAAPTTRPTTPRLDHRRNHDHHQQQQQLFIQMEYCPRTLRDVLDAGDMNMELSWKVLRQIAMGLAHIHAQGIIHRGVWVLCVGIVCGHCVWVESVGIVCGYCVWVLCVGRESVYCVWVLMHGGGGGVWLLRLYVLWMYANNPVLYQCTNSLYSHYQLAATIHTTYTQI